MTAIRTRLRVVVRVKHDHTADAKWDGYHKWWLTDDRVKADRNGRLRPNMYSADWLLWRCNNTDCGARALVSIESIQALLEEQLKSGNAAAMTL